MKNRKSIAVIICYYGKFPWYFAYFLHSCRYNPTIDFYIVTDNLKSPYASPPNVKFIVKSLEETRSLASQRLGFEAKISEGYKFCDFKPAYGFIFYDLIDSYDFWGYADIDIILGDIRDFATDDILETHDLLSVQPYFVTGCFLLFRNSPKMNTLFKLSKDHKKVFTSDTHYCFDETNYTYNKFNEGLSYHQIPSEIESITHLVKKLEEQNCIKPYFNWHIIEGRPGRIVWRKGKMIYNNKFMFAVYHLFDLKLIYDPGKLKKIIPDIYRISANRIYNAGK